jgi:DNA-3-methyladenine glycosylase
MGIGAEHNRADLTRGALTIRAGRTIPDAEVAWGPRVGIRVASELPYRAYVAKNPYVSGRRTGSPRAGSSTERWAAPVREGR